VSAEKLDPLQVVQIPVKTATGKSGGEVSLRLGQIDKRVRYRLLKEAVVMYEANKRVGTSNAKTRAAVAGSGKKPWRQKGAGRARSGSRKSPLWRGGGVVFGPHPRDYSYSINRKQRQLATRSALLGKLRDQQVIVLDELKLDAPSTKTLAATLAAIGTDKSCLIGTTEPDRNLVLSARNLPGVLVAPLRDFNARDVLRSRTIVLLKDAFEALAAQDAARDAAQGEGD